VDENEDEENDQENVLVLLNYAKTTTIKAMPSTVSQPNRQVAVFHGRTKVLPLTIFALQVILCPDIEPE
jgi:hypothetical protein